MKFRGDDLRMRVSKKRILIIIFVTTTISALTFLGIYRFTHPTHYLYSDHWIIGKNIYEIEKRYGKFDISQGNSKKGYCVKPSRVHWWGTNWPEYYMIHFDENNKAYEVAVEVGDWGG